MKESFLERAKENLDAAEMLLERERFNASANRSYYAAFHAALAALFHFGYKPDIDHKPVQASFNSFLIHQRKVFPSDMKSSLLQMLNVRVEADYRTGIGRKKALAQLKQASQFLQTIFKVIKA
ncbi:MAG: HEPN domain-containing protein [Candidatus Kapaibacterium sp.]|nr:MAG: HEPN domain-containing protein [Candidatus Kapabacteria bacterium]